MQLPPAAAQRFQQFEFSAWLATDLPQREIMARAGIDPRRRKSFARSFHGNSILTMSEARAVTDTVAPLLRINPDQVWEWILGTVAIPETIHELSISSVLQPRRLPAQVPVLAEFEARATEQIAWSVVPKISALEEEIVKVVHRNITLPLGTHAARTYSDLNRFHRARQTARSVGEQLPSKQILLHFLSDLLKFRDGVGYFAGLTDDQRARGISDYAQDTIDHYENLVGVVDDLSPDAPRDLIAHFRQFEAVFVLDTTYMYKVHHGGLLRTTCASISEDSQRALIRREAAMLHELKKYVRHGWTRPDMKSALTSLMAA